MALPLHSKPLVSVVIAARNAEKYIARSLNSIFAQDYAELEVVLVDDGSSDATVEAALALGDARLRVVRGEGRGISYARNLGLREICGLYCMFCDADDELCPGALSQAVDVALGRGLDIVLGGVAKVYPNGRAVTYALAEDDVALYEGLRMEALVEAAVGYDSTIDPRLNACLLGGSWAKLISVEAMGDLRYDESLRNGEDVVFNVALFARCKRAGVVPAVWYRYYQNPGSAVNGHRPRAFEDSADVLVALRALLDGRLGRSMERRVVYQAEGVALQSMGPRGAFGLGEQRDALKRGFEGDVWREALRAVDPGAAGLGLRHRVFFELARRRLYGSLALLMRVKQASM